MFFIKFQEYFEKMYLYSWFYGHSKDIKDFLLFFLSLFVKQNALELQAFFSSADFFSEYWGIWSKKNILQTDEQLIQFSYLSL